jgi:hypothetical protein
MNRQELLAGSESACRKRMGGVSVALLYGSFRSAQLLVVHSGFDSAVSRVLRRFPRRERPLRT